MTIAELGSLLYERGLSMTIYDYDPSREWAVWVFVKEAPGAGVRITGGESLEQCILEVIKQWDDADL